MPNAPRIITVDDLRDLLATGPVEQFWNVLTDDYYTGELIPRSRHVALDHVGREATESRLAKDASIVVYCSGVTCPHSGMAGAKLATLGFTNVRVFEGGLADWKSAGLTIEREAAAA